MFCKVITVSLIFFLSAFDSQYELCQTVLIFVYIFILCGLFFLEDLSIFCAK